MAKRTQAKNDGSAKSGKHKHGKTYCRYCTTKIAYGMQFCSKKCKDAYVS